MSSLSDGFKKWQAGIEVNSAKIKELMIKFEESFDYKFKPFEMSKELDLCLIDVNSGSDTKLMVKQVLEWAKAK